MMRPVGLNLGKARVTRFSLKTIWKALGPGVITGAADDDPSGIATYSQAGAQFGFGLTWTMFLTLPFMAAIQIISAWIGWRTGSGLARNIAQQLPKPALYLLVALLVYIGAAFTVDVPWSRVIASMLVPHLSLDRDFLLMIVAVFGTTISPYLFFWQASQEAEESRLSHRRMHGGA